MALSWADASVPVTAKPRVPAFPNLAEHLPIKLTPGFIVVAFRAGCINCNFCCVATDNFRRDLFDSRKQYDYPLTPMDAVALLQGMPSFSIARVPLRIGNDTDFAFQRAQTLELIELVPPHYPISVLTRFPLRAKDARFLENRRNVVLKVTVTPSSDGLTSPKNADSVLESLENYRGTTFLTVGPLTADNAGTAAAIVERLPVRANFRLHFKLLNKSYDRDIQAIPEVSAERVAILQRRALDRGHVVASQLMCATNGLLRIGHKRVADVPEAERGICATCASISLCYDEWEPTSVQVANVAAQLGLNLMSRPERIGFKSIFVDVDAPTAYGDEAFLSEMLGIKVKARQTPAGTLQHRVPATTEVLERWERAGFFPYAALKNQFEPFLQEVSELIHSDGSQTDGP